MHKNTFAKKFMITVAGTALLSLLLVACGTDAQSSTAAASTGTAPTTTAAPVSTTTSVVSATAGTSGETTTTSPARSTTQLLSIRMIDSLNGWALTNERI